MNNKRQAVFLFFTYGIILTAIITFASSFGDALVKELSSAIHDAKIEDVEVELQSSYIVGKIYYPSYTAIGSFEDDGLEFESLDSTVSVNKTTGSFIGKSTGDEKTTGRIRITSIHDKNFEKIITLNFEKRYPESFSAKIISKSDAYDVDSVYVGIPIAVYTSIPKGQTYSETEYEIIYDEEYFERGTQNYLIPKKATPSGETVSVSVLYANGARAETKTFTIEEAPEAADDFAELRLNYKPLSDYDLHPGTKSYFISLHDEDGTRIITDYELTTASEGASLNYLGNLVLNDKGNHTVTVTLPSGFSRDFDLKVTNVLNLPKFKDNELNTESRFELQTLTKTNFGYSFPSGTTYKDIEFIYNPLVFDVVEYESSFSVTGKISGEADFTIVLDDGDEKIEKTYTVNISDEKGIAAFIKNHTRFFVVKMIGHMGGFVILGILGTNMFRYVKIKNKLIRIPLFLLCGALFAFLTEFIQSFIPSRTSKIDDVIIDLSGYLIGALALKIIFDALNRRKRKLRRRAVFAPLGNRMRRQLCHTANKNSPCLPIGYLADGYETYENLHSGSKSKSESKSKPQ